MAGDEPGERPDPVTEEAPAPAGARAPEASSRLSRRRLLPLALLVGGALVAMVLTGKAPREQHVRFVLGDRAADVTGLEVQYVAEGGEVAREARLAFEPGRAPRVVAHEPSLPDGAYKLRIDVSTREGRRTAERQVTLGGGTTSVDLSRDRVRGLDGDK